MELALSRLKTVSPKLKIWGISATIGNMDEALSALLGTSQKFKLIRSDIKKSIEVVSILPDSVDELPWAGHLGVKLIDKVVPIIKQSGSTLIFTNTRSFAEIWYQKLLELEPKMTEIRAMNNGKKGRKKRSSTWRVE